MAGTSFNQLHKVITIITKMDEPSSSKMKGGGMGLLQVLLEPVQHFLPHLGRVDVADAGIEHALEGVRLAVETVNLRAKFVDLLHARRGRAAVVGPRQRQ